MKWLEKNLHLLISTTIVIPVGIIYGSSQLLPQFLDIQVASIDQANMLKAIAGLYLVFAGYWILGMIKMRYWKGATVLCSLFMLGLFCGRALSYLIDGTPSYGYLYGMFGELVLGVFSIIQLRKYRV